MQKKIRQTAIFINDKFSKKNSLLMPFSITMQTIIVYVAVMMPLEYLLTEPLLIIPEISEFYKKIFLFSLFSSIFILNFFIDRISGFFSSSIFALITIFFISLAVFKIYNIHYKQLQQIPHIFDISQDWSIQGTLVKIEGKNFGYEYQPGQVMVNNTEMIIRQWSDQEIIFQQPVLDEFFDGNLMVKSFNGNLSKPIEFQIKDPDDLYSQ